MKIIKKSYAIYNEEYRRLIGENECCMCREKFKEGDKITIAHDYEKCKNIRMHDECAECFECIRDNVITAKDCEICTK